MTTMQLLCLRLSQLQNEGRMTDAMVSLAKELVSLDVLSEGHLAS